MKTALLALTLSAACFTADATAQLYNFPSERVASTVLMFGENGPAVAASVTHGQPEWKAEYENQLDKLKGTKARLGKDWWTTLSTATDMEIGGVKLKAGVYFLGLELDKEGKFHLLAIDSAMAMKKKMMPWSSDNWAGETRIPLTFNKGGLEKSVDKMKIALSGKEDMTGGFAIHWGTHELAAKVKFMKAE